MATETTATLLLTPEEGPQLEIDTDGQYIFIEEYNVLGGWWFRIDEKDWSTLKAFVDKKFAQLK